MEKEPTEKMGDLVVPQIHLTKVQGSGFFYVRGRGNWRDCFCKTEATSRIPVMIGMSVCKE